jgi:HlyD family secretion protein
MKRTLYILIIAISLPACEKQEEVKTYESAPVIRGDIIVSVEAAGVIEPALTVEVKSKASGEILSIQGEAGDLVEQGDSLVRIDKRSPNNQLAQADAELEAALARRSIAEAQSRRSKTLFESGTLNEVEYEQTILEFANAKAEVIRSQVAVENARIALDDTDVRAPMKGTIIEKLVEKGQVISSPTMDVGGGTLILIMADLSTVEVHTLVDETDIGKIQPGQPVTVTVTAYPNQPFEGIVSKIEPKAEEEQTVTTFSVLIILDNASGLLRPGMNADVEIRIAERRNVLAVPTIALKVDEDIPIASRLVGLSEASVRQQIEASTPATESAAGEPGTAPNAYAFGNRYWVFVGDDLTPVAITVDTGLTDLNYSEVLSGLAEGDEVLMLPSTGLIRSQERFQAQIREFTSIPGMNKKEEEKDSEQKPGKKE